MQRHVEAHKNDHDQKNSTSVLLLKWAKELLLKALYQSHNRRGSQDFHHQDRSVFAFVSCKVQMLVEMELQRLLGIVITHQMAHYLMIGAQLLASAQV